MSDVERFLDGLRRQRAKYEEMSAVAEEQRRALEASDMDRLLAVVERKRALLTEIAALDRDVAPFRERWDTLKVGVGASAAKAVEEIVTSIRATLKELVRQEDEGRAALEGLRRSADADALAKARARGAYGSR